MSEQERIDPAQVQEEDTVVTADGEHLGHVIAFWPDMLAPSHLVVEGGRLLHHDWYVPAHAMVAYHPPRQRRPGTRDPRGDPGRDRRGGLEPAAAWCPLRG